MPTITVTAPAPMVATVHIDGTTVRDVALDDLGDGLVAIELGGASTGARIVGPADIVHALIIDADRLLTRLR
jgi:hypothetical protein